MATLLYINPDPATQSRATALGCGWLAAVPAQYASIAAAPCVVLNGAGQTVVISDNPPTTAAAVQTALQPILNAEAAAAAAAATQEANRQTILQRAQTALAANATFLALASPTAAQTAAQAKALTRECNGLIRLLLGALTDVSDT